MIITTTNSIENAKIEKYLGVVTTNLVIGTNFFSDFKASFTDFFGGMSGTYRKQMDTLYQRAYEALSLKATHLGANGILGFKIDFDELSGKGVQMFMISVSGTAVKLQFAPSATLTTENVDSVSSIQLNIALFKEKWQIRNQEITPSAEELNFIMEHRLWDLAPSLYDYYVAPKRYDEEVREIDEKFPIIVSSMPYESVVSFIYTDYANRSKMAYTLIKNNYLFNPQNVLNILHNHDLSSAFELLQTEKNEYTKEDLKAMLEIVSIIENLPDKGKIDTVKNGAIFSKLEEMYICPYGHKNDKDIVFCNDCGLNIKGLRHRQVLIFEQFKARVRMLQKFLSIN